MNEPTEKKDQSWLKRLKEESWEAELLISTVAIFGSLQLFDLIDWATVVAFNRLPPYQYVIGYFIIFTSLMAISILTTMFITHFLLRAYWVGLVGLNSVFPDYSVEDSAYSEIYTRKMLGILPKLKKTIRDVDELSSVIFSAAFFMLIMYVYLSLSICVLLILYNFLISYVSQTILFIPLGILGVLFLFVFLIMILANFKKFKQNERIQGWYFNSVKWSSLILMGPLYKYQLQISMTFGTNFKKKKSLSGLTIFIIGMGFIITIVQFGKSKLPAIVKYEATLDNTRTHSEFYANRNDGHEFLMAPQIDEDIVQSDIVRLFIPIYSYERSRVEDICGEKPDDKEEHKKWFLDCYSFYNHVFLNNVKVQPNFLKYRQPETDQFGIIAYVDLLGSDRGNNVIKVVKNMEEPLEWEIPFQWVMK